MKKIVFLALLFSVAQKTIACSCIYQGSFLKLAPRTPLIALVKIKKWTNYTVTTEGKKIALSMEAKVITVYKGSSKTKIIKVWGDNGAQCRPYISNFAEGNYYVIALSIAGNAEEGNYYINNCGCYWLKANKKTKMVAGDISSTDQTTTTLSFAGLAQKLRPGQ